MSLNIRPGPKITVPRARGVLVSQYGPGSKITVPRAWGGTPNMDQGQKSLYHGPGVELPIWTRAQNHCITGLGWNSQYGPGPKITVSQAWGGTPNMDQGPKSLYHRPGVELPIWTRAQNHCITGLGVELPIWTRAQNHCTTGLGWNSQYGPGPKITVPRAWGYSSPNMDQGRYAQWLDPYFG